MGKVVYNQIETKNRFFFDSIPDSLFSVFSRRLKDLYAICLVHLYQTCIQQSDTFKVSREEADMILRDCIRQYKEYDKHDLVDDEGHKLTSSYLYNSLRKAGWFVQEYDDREKSVYLWFPSYSAAFIHTLNEMSNPSKITAGTYLRTIISCLEGIIEGESDPWSLLMYAKESAEKYMSAFLTIITDTRQQLQKIRAEKDSAKMLQNLEVMLNEINDGSLKQLRDEGLNDITVIRIRKDILQIRTNQSVLQAMEQEIQKGSHDISIDEEGIIEDTLDLLEQQLCTGAEAKYRELTETIARYYRTCRDSIGQAVTDTNSAEDQLKEIIRYVSTHEDTITNSLEASLALPEIALTGYTSLYKPTRTYEAVNHDADMLTDSSISLNNDDLSSSISKYSTEYLNKVLDEKMKGKDRLTNEDFAINNRDDFDLCMEIILNFGTWHPDDQYHVTCMPEQVHQGGYIMSRFYIERRKKA